MELISANEVCKLLGISKSTLYRWGNIETKQGVKKVDMPDNFPRHFKMGRSLKWDKQEILDWLKNCRTQPLTQQHNITPANYIERVVAFGEASKQVRDKLKDMPNATESEKRSLYVGVLNSFFGHEVISRTPPNDSENKE